MRLKELEAAFESNQAKWTMDKFNRVISLTLFALAIWSTVYEKYRIHFNGDAQDFIKKC